MNEAKQEKRDLTDFFLEWRDTCAIDKCTRTADVRYVHDMFDSRAQRMTAGCRASGLGGGVISVSEFSGFSGHWFNRVESEFYRPGEKTPEEGGKKYGQALKDYLFGNGETKVSPGRLNGYFLGMLRTVVNDSFDKSVVSNPVQNDDGTQRNPLENASVQNPSPADDPALSLAAKECLEDFRARLLSFWNESAVDMRLAALCAATRTPFSNPVVVEASGLKSSAFSNRNDAVVRKLRLIADGLSDDYDPEIVQFVFRGYLKDALLALGRTDPACNPFFDVF